MRFSVEQINNSSELLPNVSLGYQLFDHCSDTKSFPGILSFMSEDGLIKPWRNARADVSRLVAVVGAYTSPQTRTVAPLVSMDLTPVVSTKTVLSFVSFVCLRLDIITVNFSYGDTLVYSLS